MSLKDIKLPEAVIEFPGGDFAVRGLGFDDVSFLVQKHGQKLEPIFKDFTQTSGDLTVESIAAFALPLLKAVPEIVAEMIACASGDKDDVGIARSLPFPTQLEALQRIVELTFSVSGGPKKLVETVISMAQGTTGLLESLKA